MKKNCVIQVRGNSTIIISSVPPKDFSDDGAEDRNSENCIFLSKLKFSSTKISKVKSFKIDGEVISLDANYQYLFLSTKKENKISSGIYSLPTFEDENLSLALNFSDQIKNVVYGCFPPQIDDDDDDDDDMLSSIIISRFIYIYLLDTKGRFYICNYDPIKKNVKIKFEITYQIQAFALHNNKFVFAINSHLAFVQSSEIKKFKNENSIKAHDGRICNLVFSNNGKYVYSSSFDGWVKKWDTDTFQCLGEFYISIGPTVFVNVSPIDNDEIIAVTTIGICKLFKTVNDIKTCEIKLFDDDKDGCVCAYFSPVNPSMLIVSTLCDIHILKVVASPKWGITKA